MRRVCIFPFVFSTAIGTMCRRSCMNKKTLTCVGFGLVTSGRWSRVVCGCRLRLRVSEKGVWGERRGKRERKRDAANMYTTLQNVTAASREAWATPAFAYKCRSVASASWISTISSSPSDFTVANHAAGTTTRRETQSALTPRSHTPQTLQLSQSRDLPEMLTGLFSATLMYFCKCKRDSNPSPLISPRPETPASFLGTLP